MKRREERRRNEEKRETSDEQTRGGRQVSDVAPEGASTLKSVARSMRNRRPLKDTRHPS